MLERFTRVTVSESATQRHTEAVGLAYEAVQLLECEHIEEHWPEVAAGQDKLVVSVDGAFVPVLHAEWAEVKTLVVGELGEPTIVDGQTVVATHRHSYFSRVAEAERFQRLTFGELYRRGVETAEQLASVSDGAEWIQGCIDNTVGVRDLSLKGGDYATFEGESEIIVGRGIMQVPPKTTSVTQRRLGWQRPPSMSPTKRPNCTCCVSGLHCLSSLLVN